MSLAVPAGAAAVQRGIVDNRLETVAPVAPTLITSVTHEMGRDRLGAKWTRVLVRWPRLQPYKPGVPYAGDANADGYADAYVAELKAVVGAMTANGVKVILSLTETPQWASDQRLWTTGYSHSCPPRMSDPMVSGQFAAVAAFMVRELGDMARYAEVWNEPNTAGTFYPQTRPGDPDFAARTYLEMLKVFYVSAKRANSRAVVIAGATAPRGADDVESTSPRTFARYLHDHGADAYFDGYSHHPYPWGRPEQFPGNIAKTVWLSNLTELVKLFPSKDFYLTEYGYATQKPTLIGYLVSQPTQALYLRRAYRFVTEQYPQVKAMLWFMVQDLEPAPDRLGAYMGLMTADGARKPGWYAFSGGNALDLSAPLRARVGETIDLWGTLTNRSLGTLAAKKISLQRRDRRNACWVTVEYTLTDEWGDYDFEVRQRAGIVIYRVEWKGVCTSASVRVIGR
jgi:hypothetical protein